MRAPVCEQLKSQPLHSVFCPTLVRSARCAACVSVAFRFPRADTNAGLLCVREKLLAEKAPGSQLSPPNGFVQAGRKRTRRVVFLDEGKLRSICDEVDVTASKVRSDYFVLMHIRQRAQWRNHSINPLDFFYSTGAPYFPVKHYQGFH